MITWIKLTVIGVNFVWRKVKKLLVKNFPKMFSPHKVKWIEWFFISVKFLYRYCSVNRTHEYGLSGIIPALMRPGNSWTASRTIRMTIVTKQQAIVIVNAPQCKNFEFLKRFSRLNSKRNRRMIRTTNRKVILDSRQLFLARDVPKV